MKSTIGDRFLTITGAAAVIGVHKSTLRNWADAGVVPFFVTKGGHKRFNRQQVENWLESQEDRRA